MAGITSTLREEIPSALEDARVLVYLTAETLTEASRLLASSRPRAEAVLDKLSSTLDDTETMVEVQSQKLGSMQDSLILVLTDARSTLQRFDSLAAFALILGEENRETIRLTMEQLQRSAEILEHFAEQMSRRPLRFLTGVTPPPDSGGTEQ